MADNEKLFQRIQELQQANAAGLDLQAKFRLRIVELQENVRNILGELQEFHDAVYANIERGSETEAEISLVLIELQKEIVHTLTGVTEKPADALLPSSPISDTSVSSSETSIPQPNIAPVSPSEPPSTPAVTTSYMSLSGLGTVPEPVVFPRSSTVVKKPGGGRKDGRSPLSNEPVLKKITIDQWRPKHFLSQESIPAAKPVLRKMDKKSTSPEEPIVKTGLPSASTSNKPPAAAPISSPVHATSQPSSFTSISPPQTHSIDQATNIPQDISAALDTWIQTLKGDESMPIRTLLCNFNLHVAVNGGHYAVPTLAAMEKAIEIADALGKKNAELRRGFLAACSLSEHTLVDWKSVLQKMPTLRNLAPDVGSVLFFTTMTNNSDEYEQSKKQAIIRVWRNLAEGPSLAQNHFLRDLNLNETILQEWIADKS